MLSLTMSHSTPTTTTHTALLACCDLTAVGPPTTNYLKSLPKGVVCEEEGHGSAHDSKHGGNKTAGAATKLAAPGGDNATDEHAGHDHDDHAGHNMTDAAKAAAAPAKAKSGASAAVSGVTAACAAVVAALAVLVL